MLGHNEVSSVLPIGDQEDLVWFFGRGQVAFERSTFGEQLRRAELFTFGTRKCAACKGKGYTETPEQAIRRAIDAVGQYQERHQDQIRAGKMPRLPPWYADENGRIAAGADGSCRDCAGSGWLPRASKHRRSSAQSVRETKSHQVRTATEPSTDDLERYGFVSHRLRQMPLGVGRVLAAFFGVGSRYEDDKRLGRIFGVLSLVPAGKTLLKASRDKTKNEDRLPDDVVLATEAELELTQTKPQRKALLKAGIEQAEAQFRAAEDCWMERDRRPPVAAGTPRNVPALPPRPVDLRLETARRSLRIIEIIQGGA